VGDQKCAREKDANISVVRCTKASAQHAPIDTAAGGRMDGWSDRWLCAPHTKIKASAASTVNEKYSERVSAREKSKRESE
jgi:hypothetical protein